jgi:hypothetical protein
MKKPLITVVLITALAAFGVPGTAAAVAPARVAPAIAVPVTGGIVFHFTTPSGATYSGSGVVNLYSPTLEDLATPYQGQATISHGTATFTDEPESTYVPQLFLPSTSTYIMPNFDNVSSVAGDTVVVAVTIARGASISGTLKTSTGSVLKDAQVAAIGESGTIVKTDATNSRGQYSLAGLPTGDYRIQFNSRSSGTGNAATMKYIWSYYKSKPHLAGSNVLVVHQQAPGVTASVKTGVSGSVKAGHSLVVASSLPGDTSYNEVQIVSEAAPDAESFSSWLNAAGTSTRVILAPGSYKVSMAGAYDPVTGDFPIYWYTGPGTAPSTDETQAVAYTFTGTTSKTITFIAPSIS